MQLKKYTPKYNKHTRKHTRTLIKNDTLQVESESFFLYTATSGNNNVFTEL